MYVEHRDNSNACAARLLSVAAQVQGFVNRDNNNTNVGIDISSNNIRLVVTGNTDTYLWASNIIAQTY